MKKRPHPKNPKKRNPQDATLRNIRALKKRVKHIEDFLKKVSESVEYHQWLVEVRGRKDDFSLSQTNRSAK